jgi:signal transduction histidine kinase/HAMP domain-containing protein
MDEPRPTNRLAWRMVLAVVSISLIVLAAGASLQLRTEYQADLELVEGRLDQIGVSHLGALESGLWQADLESVHAQLEGMLAVLDVCQVELQQPDGEIIQVGAPPAEAGRTRSWVLEHEHRGQRVPLGELRVTASLERARLRLSERIWSVVGIELLRTAALSGAFLLLLYLLISRHLIVMARTAAVWAGGDLERPIQLDRSERPNRPDELSQLAQALETMRRQLAASLGSLEERADELEAEVQARVGEIKTRNRMLASEVEIRRRAEAALSESEARLALLLSQFPGALWTTNAALELGSMAGGRSGLLFVTDPSGRTLDRALRDERHSERILALHHQALEAGRASDEIAVEEHVVEILVERLEGAARAQLMGVALDITERRRLDEERLRARLLRSQKLESLGVLAGGVAHDFNNLLVGILGNTSLALAQLEPGSPGREAIESTELAARRAAELTRQMLAFSGRGRFVVAPVDLAALTKEMSRLLDTAIPSDTSLRILHGEDVPAVLADASQLRQVLMNLITNAVEAIGDGGGIITIRTELQQVDADYLERGFLDREIPPGPYVTLEVSDTGRGMDAETRERIFDPFFTTKETGHGLGMAATLGIIRGHRGTVRIYSEPGHGTAIKVLLPPADTAAPPEPHRRGSSLPDLRGKTFLVIDDEPDVRDFASKALAFAGAEVLTAVDGPSGIESYRADPERIDLVILDVKMPGMSGIECFRALRGIRPGVKVLLSSGYNEQDATNEFTGRGLTGFIQKPYPLQTLLIEVARIVGG